MKTSNINLNAEALLAISQAVDELEKGNTVANLQN